MLRIFHTADWHLGHYLHGLSRQLEHQKFLDWLLQELQNKNADALIVAGDIFDSANPSSTAQAQLYNFLVQAKTKQPKLNIILVGGNHDSASRLDAPSPILNIMGVTIIGGLTYDTQGNIEWNRLLVPISNANGEIKAWCGAMPFLRNADLPFNEQTSDPLISGVQKLYAELSEQLEQKATNKESLILTGHCYMANAAISDLSERKILGGNQHALPVELFPANIGYVALGHLHLAQSVGAQKHIRYSGSPIPLSFDETNYQHQIIQVDIKADKTVETTALKVPRSIDLLRIPNSTNFNTLPEILAQIENLSLNSDLPPECTPMLELRILIEKPEPGLRQQITMALSKLPVRLLKISTAYQGSNNSLADIKPEERLEELQPLDVFHRCYQNKYNQEVPEGIKTLFVELLESIDGGHK